MHTDGLIYDSNHLLLCSFFFAISEINSGLRDMAEYVQKHGLMGW